MVTLHYPTDPARARFYQDRNPKIAMLRRAPWHDYSRPSTYLVTIVTKDRHRCLGKLERNADGTVHIALSMLGTLILNQQLTTITEHYPMVVVWYVCIMPDHIHLILRVNAPLPEGKDLGAVIRGFKGGCTVLWRQLTGDATAQLFADGFNDKILLREGQLDNWARYLADNPRRLAEKTSHPDWFHALQHQVVAGRDCQVIGNRFLLDVPDKRAVIIHRRYTQEERKRLFEEWMRAGRAGAVLVSAGIAKDEQRVINEAFLRGIAVIKLCQYGFGPLYKPKGRLFDACREGRYLEVSPWPASTLKETITREQCLALNAMAERLEAESRDRL